MALARTCWDRGGDANHVPTTNHYNQLTEIEVAHNLWESTCIFCNKKIYKRTDDAGLFDPWMSRALIIVEWP